MSENITDNINKIVTLAQELKDCRVFTVEVFNNLNVTTQDKEKSLQVLDDIKCNLKDLYIQL